MQKAILFDLDDTLIDTKYRHYKVVADFLEKNNTLIPSFDDYVVMRKSEQLKNAEIVRKFLPNRLDAFNLFWMENIEEEKYLSLDTEIVDKNLLIKLKSTIPSFIILSLRTNHNAAKTQFNKLAFSDVFDQVIFLPHQNANPKSDVIKNLAASYSISAMIGDAGSDYTAADENNVKFIGVQTGWYQLSCPVQYPDINEYLKENLNEHRTTAS